MPAGISSVVGKGGSAESLPPFRRSRGLVAGAFGLAALLFAAPASSADAATDPVFSHEFGSATLDAPEFINSPFDTAVDGAGNVFVTESDGILKSDPAGNVLTNFGATAGSAEGEFAGAAGISISGSDVFVADFGNHRIQQFDTAGNFVRAIGWGVDDGTAALQTCTSGCEAGISGAGDGQFDLPAGVATDGTHVYVLDSFVNGRIQKLTTAGAFVAKSAGSVGTGAGDFGSLGDIALIGGSGVVASDADNNRFLTFDTALAFGSGVGWGVDTGAAALETCTTASTCQAGIAGAGAGQLDVPFGVAHDGTNFYVADTENDRIHKYDAGFGFLASLGSLGTGPGDFDDLRGLDFAGGSLYVPDRNNNRVQKLGTDGTFEAEFGERPDGTFFSPFGVATDAGGRIYVADSNNNRIQRFAPDGTFQTSRGSPGDGPGEFDDPIDVAVDGAGNVYVVDRNNDRIQKSDPSGSFLDSFGGTGSGPGELDNPNAVDVSGGTVYVTDQGNNRVSMFTTAGVPGDSFGSSGSAEGEFGAVVGIEVSGGKIFTTEDARVQRFDSSGNFEVMWGDGVAGGSGFETCASGCEEGDDSSTVDGGLSTANHIAADPAGDLYVADQGNDRFQKFSPGGAFLGKWGTSGSGPGEFDQPQGIDAASGNVIVSDISGRIQVFTSVPDTFLDSGPDGTTINTASAAFTASSDLAGTTFQCSEDGGPFTPCSGPGGAHTFDGLTDGPHTLAIRALFGINPDPTPVEASFTVDLPDPPDEELLGAVLKLRKKVNVKDKNPKIKGRVGADESIVYRVKGRGKGRGRIRKVRFRTARGDVNVAATDRFVLKPKNKRSKRILKRALKRGKKVKVKVTAKLTDAAGNRERLKKKVRLK